ncbi:Geminin-like protein [Leptotrombidium deliense]|uniref:Geminin-like protein n=1 Tax=Leptotrombidium deliense TaxID=299467 RepID=A0A443S9R7_9ACAR|nr:Geminin-like protein [Leptotrombidium deliense]
MSQNVKRACLKTIQASAKNKLEDSGKCVKKPRISNDEAERTKKWLTDEKVEDEGYWKALAEQRRVALEKTLQENEELVTENELLKAEIEHWKKLAEKGMKLAQLLQETVDEESVEDT